MGVKGISLKFIKFSLGNRKTYVSFLDENFLRTDVRCGVPQGSILGPLLFMPYNVISVSFLTSLT